MSREEARYWQDERFDRRQSMHRVPSSGSSIGRYCSLVSRILSADIQIHIFSIQSSPCMTLLFWSWSCFFKSLSIDPPPPPSPLPPPPHPHPHHPPLPRGRPTQFNHLREMMAESKKPAPAPPSLYSSRVCPPPPSTPSRAHAHAYTQLYCSRVYPASPAAPNHPESFPHI